MNLTDEATRVREKESVSTQERLTIKLDGTFLFPIPKDTRKTAVPGEKQEKNMSLSLKTTEKKSVRKCPGKSTVISDL